MEPSELIDQRIAELSDWRGKLFARLRDIINAASPELSEDWKWETAVWVANGNVVAIGAFKDAVKINFFKGAKLADPGKLFNAGLEAKTSRSIDFHTGDNINESALTELIQAAVALNIK
jgi:hypothetical protein